MFDEALICLLVTMVVNIASDESSKLKHNGPGLLSMPVAVRDSLGSQFIITFAANHSLDRFVFFFFFYIPVSVCLMLFTFVVIVLTVLYLLCNLINYW